MLGGTPAKLEANQEIRRNLKEKEKALTEIATTVESMGTGGRNVGLQVVGQNLREKEKE